MYAIKELKLSKLSSKTIRDLKLLLNATVRYFFLYLTDNQAVTNTSFRHKEKSDVTYNQIVPDFSLRSK